MSNLENVLIIGYVWPEPGSSAAGRRMMELIEVFQSGGWEITFASAAADSEHRADLKRRGVSEVAVKLNSSDFDDFIRKLNPAVVVFDRFVTEEQFGWRVAEQCPQALRILDTEDLHCLRRARKKAVDMEQAFEETDLLTSDTAKREVASILRCDLSLIISEAEMKLLQKVFAVDGRLLHYLPFLLDPLDEQAKEKWPGFDSREHFVTIGNFRHPPNTDAVRYLKQTIWGLIRHRLPQVELHVYGAYPSREMKQMHRPKEGFYIKGRAEDAGAVVRQARLCLAPLRFGAGLKGKLVEAMQCGTPSVTTEIGAEGIAGDLEWSGIVAGDPKEFADAAVELYNSKSTWQQAQKKGIRIINERFQKEQFGPELLDRVEQIKSNLEQHRRQNFTGAMLLHHTAASTKYMSRWIEAKNR